MKKLINKHRAIILKAFAPPTQSKNHANITAETSIGFRKWCYDNLWYKTFGDYNQNLNTKETASDSELFTIYINQL